MSYYEKHNSVSGNWIKSSEVVSGTLAKIKSETTPMTSQFKDKEGNPKMQDVAKIQLKGQKEAMNVNLNRATIEALVDAYGNESRNWIDKMLTVQAEKMIVGGKRVIALYFVPEGYEVNEDESGYMVIRRKGATPSTLSEADKERIKTLREGAQSATSSWDGLDEATDEVNPADIPF